MSAEREREMAVKTEREGGKACDEDEGCALMRLKEIEHCCAVREESTHERNDIIYLHHNAPQLRSGHAM